MQKKCSRCKTVKDIKEFSKNKNNIQDGLSKICKTCAAEYHAQYREKQFEKYGKEEFLEMQWERKLRKLAIEEEIPISGCDLNKIKGLRWAMIDYPDKSFPYSLSHVGFMKKYKLSFDEYLYIRKLIKENKGQIYT